MLEDTERMVLEMNLWGLENVLVFHATVEKVQPDGKAWTDERIMEMWDSWAKNKLAGKRYFRVKEYQEGTGNLHFHGAMEWPGVGKGLRWEVVKGVPRFILRGHGGKPKVWQEAIRFWNGAKRYGFGRQVYVHPLYPWHPAEKLASYFAHYLRPRWGERVPPRPLAFSYSCRERGAWTEQFKELGNPTNAAYQDFQASNPKFAEMSLFQAAACFYPGHSGPIKPFCARELKPYYNALRRSSKENPY